MAQPAAGPAARSAANPAAQAERSAVERVVVVAASVAGPLRRPEGTSRPASSNYSAAEPRPGDPASDYNRNMPNAVKTALLLGAMSALLLFLGEQLGGAQGLAIGFMFAVVTN